VTNHGGVWVDHDVVEKTGTEAKLAYSWLGSVDLAEICSRTGSPVFIYSEAQLVKNVTRIKQAAEAAGLGDRVELYVPFFPNSNPHVLAPFQELGVGLLVQLPSEYRILRRFGFDRFIVSPGHVSDEEMTYWAEVGQPTFLSSLDEVSFALNAGAPTISARIDSLDSGKPGIKLGELKELSELLARHGRELECFEVYCGSGNSREEMIKVVETLFSIFNEYFPKARSVNFAGGHGFVYEAWDETEKHFGWGEYFQALREIADRMGIPEHVKLLFEPARDVLADVGALVLDVERNVIANPVSNIVVTNGSRMLMPSAQLRDRQHHVVFLDPEYRELPTDYTSNGVQAALRGRTILRHDYILPGDCWVAQ
jgi:diaminopimelate decarboxylase